MLGNTGMSKIENEIASDSQMQYYTIDGFEVPDEWRVQFSKYRSKRWNKKDEKQGDETREPDREWYDWFKAGEGTAFSKKEILPDFIVKNDKLFNNEKSQYKELTILGVKARWDFAGYNWIAVTPKPSENGDEKRYGPNKLGRYPVHRISDDSLLDQEYQNYDGGNYILLPGQTSELALYAWGSSYDYNLEFHVEDVKGRLHVLDAGSVDFKGWHRLVVSIPDSVRQVTSYLPRAQPLKLKRLKMVLNPEERITGTYVYLDYLHGKTDTYLQSFFGEGLENSQRIWKRKKEGKTQETGKGNQ